MDWTIDRRNLIAFSAAGFTVGASAGAAHAGSSPSGIIKFDGCGLDDASGPLQQAINRASGEGAAIALAPGRITIRGPVRLPSWARLLGAAGLSMIECREQDRLIGEDARDILVAELRLDASPENLQSTGLIELNACRNARLARIEVSAAPADGLLLWRLSSRIEGCRLTGCQQAAIRAGDSTDLVIHDNVIEDIANNGIVAWREAAATDGTQISTTGSAGFVRTAGEADRTATGSMPFAPAMSSSPTIPSQIALSRQCASTVPRMFGSLPITAATSVK